MLILYFILSLTMYAVRSFLSHFDVQEIHETQEDYQSTMSLLNHALHLRWLFECRPPMSKNLRLPAQNNNNAMTRVLAVHAKTKTAECYQ